MPITAMLAVLLASALPVAAQAPAFEADSLRCVRTWNDPLYLQRVYENGRPIVGFSFSREVRDRYARVGTRDPNRVLTFLAQRRLEIRLPDCDPLRQMVELQGSHAADPVYLSGMRIAEALSQGQGNYQGLGAPGVLAAPAAEEDRNQDQAVTGATTGGISEPDADMKKVLGDGLLNAVREAVKEHGHEGKAVAYRAAISKLDELGRRLQEGVGRLARERDGEAAHAASAERERKLAALDRAIARFRAILPLCEPLREYLMPFAQAENWDGGDYLLRLSEQSPQRVACYQVRIWELADAKSAPATGVFAVRYGYFWEILAFDLSAAVVYHRLGDPVQLLAQRASGTQDLGLKSIDYTAAVFGNLCVPIKGSWAHPMVQLGVAKGTRNLVLLLGGGVRLSEPFPVSLSGGWSRGRDGNGSYVAIGFNFH